MWANFNFLPISDPVKRTQQGGPLSSLVFCEAIDPLLKSLDSDVTLGFMDDISLSGELGTVEGDVEAIIQSASEIGLKLNQAKCEIIMEDFSMIDSSSIFKNFIRVERKIWLSWDHRS